MIKKFKYAFLLSIFFTIGICTHSFARITTNDPTVNSGETVTIVINSQEPVASGAINISQNSGLIFKSVSGGTANGTLVAFSKTNNSTSGIATYTFTAPEVSKDTVYKLVFSSQDMADENNNAIANSTATATVTVKAKTSTNNPNGGNTGNTSGGTQNPKPDTESEKVKLQSLKINNTTYKKQLKTNLYVTVEAQEEITLLPKTTDGSSCTITNSTNKETKTVKSGVSQKIKLNEGTNKITIKGSFDETYTIIVTNKKKEEETEPNVIEEPEEEQKIILKNLIVKGIKLATEENEEEEKIDLILTPEFSSEVYEYTLNIPEEQNDIIKLDIEAIGDKEDFTIEIMGNENLVYGENIITILVKSKDGEKTAEYKIKVNKVEKVAEVVTEPVLDETPNTGVEDNFKDIIKLIIGGFTVLIAVVAIVIVLIKFRKKEDDEEIEQFNNTELENDEVKRQEGNADNVSSEDNNHSKGIDFTSILKNKIEEKNEVSNRKRMERERNEELESTEETFEVLKEENTISKKKGKHF